MIKIQFMKPFHTKVNGAKLRIVFAYQYLAIKKDDEIFHFIPIEGKEIIVDLTTMQAENLSEVFVFQRGNRFIRLPIYQLMLVSDIHDYLKPILEETNTDFVPDGYEQPMEPEIVALIEELEEQNMKRAIDEALENRDKTLFMHLMGKLQNNS